MLVALFEMVFVKQEHMEDPCILLRHIRKYYEAEYQYLLYNRLILWGFQEQRNSDTVNSRLYETVL